METIIHAALEASIDVKRPLVREHGPAMVTRARRIAECLAAGNKVLLFGNGGSAADAQHIAAEFVNRFRVERPPLSALALTTDTSVLTSIGNDYSFDEIFSKQVRALGRKGDVAVGISTSGNSKNVIAAVTAAAEMALFTIGLSGPGGRLAAISDLAFRVDSDSTARIQETHIFLGHMLCDLVDRILFPRETIP